MLANPGTASDQSVELRNGPTIKAHLQALQDGRTRQHALRVSDVQLAGKARATIISDLVRSSLISC